MTEQAINTMDEAAVGQMLDIPDEESLDQIDARIKNTFTVLVKVARGLIEGNIRSVIVSGAAGCGKTYTLEHELTNAENEELISYDSVKGAMSPIGLYRKLWENREEGHVLVIDDCDSIFGDLDALNLLKAALDTTKHRKVHWNKESRILDEEGIDRSFEFDGAVVFITNIDFTAEIEQEKRMTPHYKALLSRCMYVDLGIHSKREILVRITQVMFSKQFLRDNRLGREHAQDMFKWLNKNLERVRALSIRTILQLAALVKTDADWVTLANTIMLKRR
jgi:hypothetical protein